MENIKLEDLDGKDLPLNDNDREIIAKIFGEPRWEEHTSNDFLLYFALALVITVIFVIFKLSETDRFLSGFVSSYESLLLLEVLIIFLLVVLLDRIFLGIRGRINGWKSI